jgi:hypothetical protein
MIHYLDTIAYPEMEREGLLPAFTTLIDMSQNTHYRSTTDKAIDIVDRRDRPDIPGKAEIFEQEDRTHCGLGGALLHPVVEGVHCWGVGDRDGREWPDSIAKIAIPTKPGNFQSRLRNIKPTAGSQGAQLLSHHSGGRQ